MNKSKSNLKSLRKSFRLDQASVDEINAFMGIHRLKSESEALRSIIAEYKVLKEQQKQRPQEKSSEEPLKSTSDEACSFLDYDRKGKPLCRNPNPPIKTRDLTPRACMICQKLMKKQQQDEIKQYHKQKKKEVHDLQKSVNESIHKEKPRFFTNEYGQRIPY